MSRTASPVARLAAAALATLACASCISLSWERERGFSPPPEGALARLEPGESDLAEALGLLGAPLWVREHERDGAQLVWGWLDEREWSGSVSYPVLDFFSLSFDYGDLARRLYGVLLVFDPEWRLVLVREGRIADLLPPKPQPSLAE